MLYETTEMDSDTSPTTVQFVLPAAEAALAQTMDRIPGMRASLERSVATCQSQPSALWISAPDEGELVEALESDPSVEGFQRLATSDDRWLIDVEFQHSVEILWSILLSEGGVLTDVTIHDGKWHFDCRFTEHAAFGTTRESLEERAFEFEVQRISHDDEERPPGAALSEKQYASIKRAWEKGYFEVPREATLEELADDMGLSHQALSERIRRGLALCVESELALPADVVDTQAEAEPVSPAPMGSD